MMNNTAISKTKMLHIKGYRNTNQSYNENFNGYRSVDIEMFLIENSSTLQIGHTILIKKVYDDSVELLVDEKNSFIIKTGETIDIISKNIEGGTNENYHIDKELLYVTLKDINFNKYSHLLQYEEYDERIDKNINILKDLIKYESAYFSIRALLKTYIFKIENQEYIDKITKLNNENSLKELKLIISNQQVIKQTIDYINQYEINNNNVINGIINNKYLTLKEFYILIRYLNMLALDNSDESRNAIDHVLNLRDVVVNDYFDLKTKDDLNLLSYLMMKVVIKSRYCYKFKFLGYRLLFDISYDYGSKFKYKGLVKMLLDAAMFFIKLYDRPSAMECYENALYILKTKDDLKLTSEVLYHYYKLNNSFPESLRKQVDIDKIKEKYQENSDIIIKAIKFKPLKVDEVEFNPKFIDNYTNIMDKVEKQIDKEGDLHVVFQRWNLMQKYYKEIGIDWKTPREMNPRVMFD